GFTFRDTPYALFLGRSAGTHVPFYRVDLTTWGEEGFAIAGSSWTGHFDILEHGGKVYGGISGSPESFVFNVCRNEPRVPDIRVSFPFQFPSGIRGAPVFHYKGKITIPQFNNQTWWGSRRIHVQFTEPFAQGRPVIGEGMLPPFEFNAQRVATRPG